MTLATHPSTYGAFLESKSHIGNRSGFEPIWMPDFLFDFQRHLLDWAIRQGRAALFADCGLGKTPMQLVWAENVVRKQNKSALILTPLAVAAQTIRESEKFGIEAVRSGDGRFPGGSRIVVTNYERLHMFDPNDFAAIVCDESSILKNFEGVRRDQITEFMKRIPLRLLATATAAPNDYTELGTSAEALGELGYMDMLSRFFVNDNATLHLLGTKHGNFSENRWRFKAHSETHFWRWICSWARACRRPSDFGFEDGRFKLPELSIRETLVKASRPAPGMLFEVAAETLDEQREEARRTVDERCEAVADLVRGDAPAVVWCQLNRESELLEKLIPGAKQITGSQSDDEKEELFEAFATGTLTKIITKPKIGGFGLNWQHCRRMTFFPSHSFEQFYQAIRRCWRFGQAEAVTVDVVTTEGGAGVRANLMRKQAASDQMFARLVSLMNQSMKIGRTAYGDRSEELPSWL